MRQRRRIRLRPHPSTMAGMGQVAALIVGADPRPRGQGMASLEESPRNMGALVDQLAGTTLGNVLEKLDQVSLALKISTVAAVAGAVVALIGAVLRGRK